MVNRSRPQIEIPLFENKMVVAASTGEYTVFRIQEKPSYRSFLIVQNISKSINVFKNCG